MSDDLLTEAEADALIARYRIIVGAPVSAYEARTPGGYRQAMQNRRRPLTDTLIDTDRRARATEFIPVLGLGEMVGEPVKHGTQRAREYRARKRERETQVVARRRSPLDDVARPLLDAARSRALWLRVCPLA